VEKCCTAGQATDDNTAHAHCMLDTLGYKHTLTIWNTYCFFHCNSCCTAAPQCYVTRTVTVMSFLQRSVRVIGSENAAFLPGSQIGFLYAFSIRCRRLNSLEHLLEYPIEYYPRITRLDLPYGLFRPGFPTKYTHFTTWIHK